MKIAPGYKTLSLIRIGGPEAVYDVWSEERRCRCIAKLIRKKYHHSQKARRRLRAEADLLLSLTHPHIVRAYELVDDSSMALIMETLPGETLSYIIQNRKRSLPARDVALLGIQICSALSYLHRKGFLHLDLKPSNIICNAGIVRLIDFGLARPPGYAFRGIGTPNYLSPEQAKGKELSTATDMFGLGAVLFEACVGSPPFKSDSRSNHYEQSLRRATPVRSIRRLPIRLSKLIDGCLESDPAYRPGENTALNDLESIFRQ